MKVKDFLKKNNALSEEIHNVNFHMQLLNVDLDELKIKIPELKEKDDKELLAYIVRIFKQCDSLNPSYDEKLDTEMVRLGLKTNVFRGGHCHNIWNNRMFPDDGFGFGTEPTAQYDDFVDRENDRRRM